MEELKERGVRLEAAGLMAMHPSVLQRRRGISARKDWQAPVCAKTRELHLPAAESAHAFCTRPHINALEPQRKRWPPLQCSSRRPKAHATHAPLRPAHIRCRDEAVVRDVFCEWRRRGSSRLRWLFRTHGFQTLGEEAKVSGHTMAMACT